MKGAMGVIAPFVIALVATLVIGFGLAGILYCIYRSPGLLPGGESV